jgi:hypothetical protein
LNFIERLFGVSPDGGSGTTELIYLVVAGIVVLSYIGRKHIRTFLAKALNG